jgi:hypothetical protein
MKKLAPFLIALLIHLPPQAQACTIPVFRYALEKWDLTRYDISVYHRGPLPADLELTLKAWNDAPNKANLDITTIDLAGKVAPKWLKHWQREGKKAELPCMLVRYQEAEEDAASAWSGPCTADNLQRLADSPIRQAVLRHLTRGDSCVFVLLTSDDAATDRAVSAKLQKNLATLEKKIKLETPIESDLAKLRLPLPIKVTLPLLTLDRTQPDEAAFIKLLLTVEPDLDKIKGPILFPFFGRGRVLYSLSGAEIETRLSFVAEFLCKGCSCDVKGFKPGIDMLMLGNWNEIFETLYEKKETAPLPAESRTEAPAPKSPHVVDSPSAPTPTVVEQTPVCFDCPIARNWHWIAGALVLGAGAWCFYLWRK